MAANDALGLAFLACPRAPGQDDAAHKDVPPILKIGSQAPDFNLPGVDGKSHSLKDYASSKVLVVIFSCNHCPVAQMYEKRIKQSFTEYQSRGVAVVVIMGNDPKAEQLTEYGYTDVGDSFADMKARAAYRNFPYPYLYDGATQSVALSYGPTATPMRSSLISSAFCATRDGSIAINVRRWRRNMRPEMPSMLCLLGSRSL